MAVAVPLFFPFMDCLRNPLKTLPLKAQLILQLQISLLPLDVSNTPSFITRVSREGGLYREGLQQAKFLQVQVTRMQELEMGLKNVSIKSDYLLLWKWAETNETSGGLKGTREILLTTKSMYRRNEIDTTEFLPDRVKEKQGISFN